MTNKQEYHVPVMLKECLDALQINPDGVYVDVTFGGGGHSKAIFEKLSSKGRLIAFDQDPDAKKNTWEAPNFDFVAANFAYINNHLRLLGVKQVDGILADLGVSSHQFDEEERGFSIRGEAKLDMRMSQSGELTAEDVVNDYTEEELLRVFRSYGEIPNARKLVNAIVGKRLDGRVRSTGALLGIAGTCAPKYREHKYFAQVFQAIRIEVNDEMSVLEGFLNACEDALKPGGRLVVMSYHSLEDRMVKNYMKRGSISGKIEKDFFGNVLKSFTEVVRHPIVPGEEELERNNRARSAKLRIAERNG
ncbi:MAG: 16S rRNA (cytosine(1402)-N(4))-methyltransferase RsmH [Crocinitomicaceae bacterium]|nr:16S rRNA (cytosine(1402)-N(4))-methyltransferase RsmH [Crocinitomicaceae bacterium]